MLTPDCIMYIVGALIGCITVEPSDRNVIMCSSTKFLKNIDYLPNITVISVFEKSKKQTLMKGDFIGLPNLENLNLNSAINGIEDGAVYELGNLRSFFCDDCDIPIIKANFFNNPNLTVITFERSNVRDIEEGVFSKTPKLRDVTIEENHIRVIRRGVFSNTDIYTIYLRSNKIEIIEDGAFMNMKNLNHLELQHNLLKSFDSIKLFEKSLSLSVLQLANNTLKEINKNTISVLRNLKYFNASKNEIETIQSNSFYDLKHLLTIALSNNRIKELKPDVINENSNLTYLFLHGNDLSFISNEFLVKLPYLSGVTISGNPWECACQNDLISYMKKNNIKDICTDIDSLKCSSNESGCKYNVELSKGGENVKKSLEKCYVSWWNYY